MTLQVTTDNETDACGQRHTFGKISRLAGRYFSAPKRAQRSLPLAEQCTTDCCHEYAAGECLSIRLCHASPECVDGLQVPMLSRVEGVVCCSLLFSPKDCHLVSEENTSCLMLLIS